MTLGEIAARAGGEIRTGPFGSQLHKADYVEGASATPVVMPKDMVEGKIGTCSIARIDHETVERLSAHVLRAGDIVLSRRGDIGRRAWTGQDEDGWLCGTGSMRVSLNGSPDVRSRFVFYYLALPETVAWLEGHSVGATMSNLSAGVVGQLPVRFPSLVHQDQVVETLDAFDDLIDNNRRRIEILEEMARLLYREWFVHFRFPGHEDVGLVKSELGPIPEGWEVARVDEIQSPTRNATAAGPFGSKLGRKDYVDQGVPVIRGTNLTVGGGFEDGGFVYVSEDKAATLGSSTARPGDILVTQRGTLGQCGLIPDTAKHGEYVISQSQMKLTCDERKIYPLIIYMQLALPEGVQRVLSMATGSGVPHINLGMFREMKVLVPSLRIQEPFVEAVEPMLTLERNLRAQNDVLREARDLLLPRLVSGDLDVSELNLDDVLA